MLHKSHPPIIAVVLLLCLIVSSTVGQKRTSPARRAAPPAPVEPVVTFDTLLSDDTYKIYGEIRNVGQLVRSAGVNDLIEPFTKLSQPPQEFQTVLKWLQGNADSLATSRLMVAGWPNRPALPTVLLAVEFATPDEAKKFEASLKRL